MKNSTKILLVLCAVFAANTAQANLRQSLPPSEQSNAVPVKKPTGGGDNSDTCKKFPDWGQYLGCPGVKQVDTAEILKACKEFPTGHPMSCENLLYKQDKSANMIQACNQFPTGHPMSCENLALVGKCPPGEVPGLGCRHQLVQNAPMRGILRDKDGQLKSVTSFGVFKTAGLEIPVSQN